MTSPMCEDGGTLREWAPLAMLLQQIPAKIQTGLFTHNINFTCIDAVPEFIAIGTNYGLVYWFDREKQDLQRLRCENVNSKITCIQVISTVDYMVAAGNEHGVVTVFQIPKNPPDSLPDSLKPKQKKQVERYSISGLHNSAVTTVEWSKNGMKLFSGDQDGLVVLTEIDFYMHLSKSSELLNEKYAVVQLSYQQGLLLVSTTLRTILVNRNENGKVTQVGQKERKTLGRLGAVFGCRQNYVQDLVIYASRPGLRLWQADKTGTVLKTLIFKDAVRSGHTEVELLNPAPESCKKNRGEPTFGVILPFCDDLLITYSDDIIYVVNPQTIAITSIVTDLRRVTNVACTKDEIFVLEGERNIIRIAYYPETNMFSSEAKSASDPLLSFAEISKPVTNGILELTSKLMESTIVPAIPFHKINPSNIIQSVGIVPIVTIGTDVTSITSAEEAVEVPVMPDNLNSSLITDSSKITEHNDISKRKSSEQNEKHNDRRQIFEKISQQEFEDVVFTPERKIKKSHNRLLNGNGNCSSLSDINFDLSAFNKDKINANDAKTMHSSLLTLCVDDDFISKTERNLESIQRDVENKEKLLADVLDFDLSKYMTSSQINTTNSNMSQSIDTITYIGCAVHSNNSFTEEKIEQNEYNDHSDHTETESGDEDVSYRTELRKLEDLGECRKKLLQDKLNEPLQKGSYVDGRKMSHSTVVPNEFMISTTIEEEDWVLVKNDIPPVAI
ncbi:WD repeat-containing protein CG11141 isoform X2 [Bombus vosnesenskii]|uniref:WD repeat-containing protein CG11141 isoform X2 n=1 Tax=Bombus vosnesenskii TaxID=207650 RepID=A0A6J3KTH9_9HYME|nr:WD repeat-containing protein CG11141 isoform X2 [Bombus vancouverensis nearcticus]XP_033356360.1 WD repeat-containing protein CG11141 isoform X2 [Bombus vosnesenskii]XP_050480708.1 WD repeat-containing protein CG11141 isoform X2 [Bombus huntii]